MIPSTGESDVPRYRSHLLLMHSCASDVVFHIAQPRGRSGRRTAPKKIYAIKKILASRSEYFADMFNGGFAEAERAEDSEEEMEDAGLLLRSRSPLDNAPAHPQGAPEFGRGASSAQYCERAGEVEADDYERGPEALLEDSDEELDDDADCWSLATPPPASSMMGGAPAAPASGDGGHKSGDMSEEDEDDEVDDDRPVEDDVIQFGAGKSTSGGGDAGISSNMHSPLGGADGEVVSSDQGRSANWPAGGTAEGTASTSGGRTPAKQQRLASTALQVTGDRSMSGNVTPSRPAVASSSAHAEGVTRALLQSGSAKRDRPDVATTRNRSASDRRKRRKVVSGARPLPLRSPPSFLASSVLSPTLPLLPPLAPLPFAPLRLSPRAVTYI
jgi:hypothetical protein